MDRNGIGIAADALTLNGGSIEASKVAAALGLGSHAITNDSGHQVNDSPALLRHGDGGEPALDRRHGRQPATAPGQRRRRHGELQADRTGHGGDAEPAPGPGLERRHAHDLGHARRHCRRRFLHLDRDRRRRRRGAAFVRPHGGRGQRAEADWARVLHEPPRRRLQRGRANHGDHPVQQARHGDRRAATGDRHRRQGPPGPLSFVVPGRQRQRDLVPVHR